MILNYLISFLAGGEERFWYLSKLKSKFSPSGSFPNYLIEASEGKYEVATNCGVFEKCVKDGNEVILGIRNGPGGTLVFIKPGYFFAKKVKKCAGKNCYVSVSGSWLLATEKDNPGSDFVDVAFHFDEIAPGWRDVPYSTEIPMVLGLLTVVGIAEIAYFLRERIKESG